MLCMYAVTLHCPKGILGQGMGAAKYKLKDTNFNFPVTKVMFLSIFCTHAQKEDIKLLNLKSTSILDI